MKKLLLTLILLLSTGLVSGQASVDHMMLVPFTHAPTSEISLETALEYEKEMTTYVVEYMEILNMVAPRVRWIVYVLDELEFNNTPAVVKYWPAGQQWIVIFHFNYSDLIALTERGKRVIVAHEIGHLTGRCMLLQAINLQEICADVISSELTSTEDVLALLKYFQKQWPLNTMMEERIDVIENLQALKQLQSMEREVDSPTLYETK